MRASLKALIAVAVMLAASVQSGALALTLLPAIPVPFALVGLRYGHRPAIGMSAGLFVAGIAGGFALGDAVTGVQLAAIMVLAAGALAIVLTECGMGRRFQQAPLAAATLSYLVLCAALLGATVGATGVDGIRSQAVAQIDETYAQSMSTWCDPGSPVRRSEAYCTSLQDQRDLTVGSVADHTLLIVVPTFAFAALLAAITSLWLLRIIGVRAQLPVHRSHPFVGFTVHWSIAYLLSAGLVVLMAGMAQGDVDNVAAIAGVTLCVLAGAPIVAQGAAVVVWLFRRWRVRPFMQVVFWAMVVLTSVGAMAFLLGVGVLEMMVRMRARDRDRMPTSDGGA